MSNIKSIFTTNILVKDLELSEETRSTIVVNLDLTPMDAYE